MNRSSRWKMPAALGLLTLAMLMSFLAGGRTVAASETAQEAADGGPWSMGIGARTSQGASYTHIVGARFIVTSEDGEYIGECALAQPDRDVPWWNCRVDVPSDRVSLVWIDLDTIPVGYDPEKNPIAFDPTTYTTGPHNIGAFFHIVPQTDGIGDDPLISALVAVLIQILQAILA